MTDERALRIAFWKHAVPFVMVYAVVWGVAIIALPLVAKTDARAGLVFAMLNLGIGLAAAPWGHLSRRYSVGGLVFLSTLLSAAAWVLLTILGNLLLPVTALLFGVFASGTFALATVQVTKIFPRAQWDTYIAQMQSLMVGGQVIGLLATSVFTGTALGLPFLAIGVVGGALVARSAVLREVQEVRHLHFRGWTSVTMFSGLLHGHHLRHLRPRHFLTLKDSRLAIVLARWTLLLLAWAPIFAVYPLMMRHGFGFSGSQASLMYSGGTALSIPLFMAAGVLAERRSPFLSMTIGAVLSTASFVLMWIGGSAAGGAGFVLIVQAYSFVAVGMNDGVVALVSESQEGDVLGVANALMSFDNVIGGVVGGALATAFGYSALFAIGFVLSVVALGLGIAGSLVRAREPEAAPQS